MAMAESLKPATRVEPCISGASQANSWKNSRSFVLKVGCMNRHRGTAPVDHMTDISFQVSQEYNITGYQEGEDSVPSLLEVNSEILLSLEAEALGKVLGIEYTGCEVLKALTEEERMTLLRHVTRKPKQGRVLLESLMPSELRDYVRERKEKLLILENERGCMPISQAYFLKEEFYFGTPYNWAAFKVEHLKFSLKRARFSRGVKSLLAKYITAAAPAVYHVYDGQLPRAKGPGQMPPAHAMNGTSSKKGKGESVILRRSPRQTVISTTSAQPHAFVKELEPQESIDACRADDKQLGSKRRRYKRDVVEQDTEIETVELKKARVEKKNHTAVLAMKLLAFERLEKSKRVKANSKLEKDRAKLEREKKKLEIDRKQLRIRKK